jgi:hypothetical protein
MRYSCYGYLLSMGSCGNPAMNTAMDIALSMGSCGRPAMNTAMDKIPEWGFRLMI